MRGAVGDTNRMITPGSVPKRLAVGDGTQQPLTIHTSQHLRARAQTRLYDNWRNLNKHAVYYDSEHLLQGVPVGRVRGRRTHQVPRPEQDTANYQQTSAYITPGPGEYEAVGRQHAMGYNMRTFSPIFHDAGFGSGERPCLKAAPLVAPGPGAYNLSGTGVYGYKTQTFLAMEGQHRDPQLEKLRVALKNLQWRIARIREAADINTRMEAGKRRLLQLEGKQLPALLERARELRQRIHEIEEQQEHVRSKNTRFSKASRLAGDLSRPKSHPLSDRMGRFADPLHDKNKTVPGPGYYSPDSILTMGQDSMHKAHTFHGEVRPCAAHAPHSKSIACMRLTKDGYAYFADVNEPGPPDYYPPNYPYRQLLESIH